MPVKQTPVTKTAVDQNTNGEVKPYYESVGENLIEAYNEHVIGEEVEEAITRSVEQKNSQSEFDIPIVMNEQVQKWINYFQGSGKKYFVNWLSRSGKYIPMMQDILRKNDLPQDLVYLAMIESGFKPYAYSRAKASGPWQFIKGTGMRYGLRTNWWIDERRDPEKSTIAAAQHLKDLYDQFNHWYLAAAGYNAGAMKIQRAMQKYSTEDFWEMSQHKYKYLKPETKNYVPKIIAAALVAKNPQNYGFENIIYQEPIKYSKVNVPKPTHLTVIAKHLNMTMSDLLELNPELLRGVTPPNEPEYELKLPVNMDDKFLAAWPEIQKEAVVLSNRHVVRSGETLSHIAKKYGLSVSELISNNQLRSKQLRIGQVLAVPNRVVHNPVKQSSVASLPSDALDVEHHVVKRGETLWSISKKYGLSVEKLKRINNLVDSSSVKPGQILRIKAQDSSKTSAKNKHRTHQVLKGETFWSISKKYGVEFNELLAYNETTRRQKLQKGDSIKIPHSTM